LLFSAVAEKEERGNSFNESSRERATKNKKKALKE